MLIHFVGVGDFSKDSPVDIFLDHKDIIGAKKAEQYPLDNYVRTF